jgi:CubicO group peptidase (beta-lactamase class C family)
MIRSRALLAATVVLVLPRFAPAQVSASDSVSAVVDRVFAPMARNDGPGCAVGVYRNGQIAFAKGYGLANLEYNTPITPSTPFIVGSVSKQFTAAAITLLAEQGKLSFDDDVRKYIPELPDYGKKVTIGHMVHHTSGLRDWWELVGLSGLRYDDGYSSDDVFAMAVRQKGLNFTPGERYMYSNTGYVMLGVVVKRVTGKSLREFTDEAFFRPLGMTHTHFHDDHTMLVPGRARSYAPDSASGSGWKLADWNNDIVGQGGLMTTVEDLAKWDANFSTGQVGGQGFLKRQLVRGVFNNGKTDTYASGLTVTTYRGLPIVEHGGSSGGYRAQLSRYPTANTSVSVLCNASNANPGMLAQRVADGLLGDKFTEGPRAMAAQAGRGRAGSDSAITLSPMNAARLAGKYYSEELGSTYEIVMQGGSLVLRRPRQSDDTLRATDARTLVGRAGTLRFPAGTSAAPRFTLEAGRVREITFVKR